MYAVFNDIYETNDSATATDCPEGQEQLDGGRWFCYLTYSDDDEPDGHVIWTDDTN